MLAFLCAEVIHSDRLPIKVNKTFNNDFLMTVVKQMYKSREPNISQLIYVWFTISASRRVIMSAFSIVDFIIVFLTQTSSAALLTNRQPSGANAWNSFFFAWTDFLFPNLSHYSGFSTIMYTTKMVKIRTLLDLNFAFA